MEQEKTRLLAQTIQLKRLISSVASGQTDVDTLVEHQLVKRIKTEHHSGLEGNSCDSSDEGIHIHLSPKIDLDNVEEVRNELIQVRKALDRERKLRMSLEDQVKSLETQLYPERVKEIAQSVQVRLARGGLGSECGYSDEDGMIDDEGAAAVASLVDDEGVIAETIEIEANSCPRSPSNMMQPTTIVIQAQGGGSYSTPVHFSTATSQASNVPRIIKLETVSRGKSTRKNAGKSGQPAAIALPIDMPFIGSTTTTTSGTTSDPGTVTVQIINGNNNESNSVNVSNTSRHNLETIVEAIRHLEGDHFMKDDTDGGTVTVDYGGEEIVETETVEIDGSTTDSKPIKILQVSAEQLGAIRSQVIKCQQAPSSGHPRPGVIVSKNDK